MVSIVLMSVIAGALLAAVQMSVRSSSVAFKGAATETVLLNATDRIARAPQLCNYENYVDAAALAEGWDVAATTVTVERLVANTGAASDWSAESCPADVGAFDVQRLTITATEPTGRVTRVRTVIKSDVN